jgi:hypothetical protein
MAGPDAVAKEPVIKYKIQKRKRDIQTIAPPVTRHPELVSGSIAPHALPVVFWERWMLERSDGLPVKQVQHDESADVRTRSRWESPV